ncbi:MAG: crossover junction endodeoxyribonuclease RuvC [Patescibacteria group bacterium]
MIILGIDPGTKRMGFGVVKKEGSFLSLLEAGILDSPDGGAVSLATIKKRLDSLFLSYRPSALAIERLYFSKNQKTAIAVAEARGVAVLAAEERGVPILEYTPTEVKSSLAGYGGADKKAVAKMVRLILGEPTLDLIDDAYDAIALSLVAFSDPKTRIKGY